MFLYWSAYHVIWQNMHSALMRSARSTMTLLPCICDGGETKGTKQQVGGDQIKPDAKIPVNQPKKKRAAHRCVHHFLFSQFSTTILVGGTYMGLGFSYIHTWVGIVVIHTQNLSVFWWVGFYGFAGSFLQISQAGHWYMFLVLLLKPQNCRGLILMGICSPRFSD